MEDTPDKGKITGWYLALDQEALSTEQIAVLDEMVMEGQVVSREAPASMLGWQDASSTSRNIYGF